MDTETLPDSTFDGTIAGAGRPAGWRKPQRPAMTYQFHAAVDPGRARRNNEDAVALEETLGLAVLADGMGGYNAGEVASDMITRQLLKELGDWLRQAGSAAPAADVERAMEACVDQANRAIFNAGSANPQYAGMGTTLVVAAFRESQVVMGHVGDSRAYRLRAGRLQQITRDHSLLQEQLDAGLITPEQAAFSSHKNLVTRAVGVEDTVTLEAHVHEVEPGDLFLLCSDGLSDMLSAAQITQILQSSASLEKQCAALVQAANEAGGRDNIAVIVARAPGSASSARAWWSLRR